MQERGKDKELVNEDTKEFLDLFVKKHLDKYRSLWLHYQNMVKRLGEPSEYMEFGYPFGQLYKYKDKDKTLAEELEFRGYTLQKFPGAADIVISQQTPIPLPPFLVDDLADWQDTLSTKGTILGEDEKIIRFENRNIQKKKSGGAVRVFPGYQLALFIKYGTRQNPTQEPTDFKLIPASLVKKAASYEGIYLR